MKASPASTDLSPKKTQLVTYNPASHPLLHGSPSKKPSMFNNGYRPNNEENIDRLKRAVEYIKEFQEQLNTIQNKSGALNLRAKLRENFETLYVTLDKIFSLYNLNMQILYQDQSDSAMYVEPLVHSGRSMDVLVCIAVVLVRFPYSFLRAIDLNKFTICKRVQLKSEGYETLFHSRILANGMFMTNNHDTFEKVEKQMYKVIAYHAKKQRPELQVDWPIEKSRLDLLQQSGKKGPGAKSVLNTDRSEDSFGGRSKPKSSTMTPYLKKETNFMELRPEHIEELKNKEQVETLRSLLKNPADTLDSSNYKLQVKAKFLKEQLEAIDSVGVCESYWEQLTKTYFDVEEGASGEFFIKM